MLKEHERAPDFTLLNQDSIPVSLANFAGQWVLLYFYPKDDTPGCTAEACAIRDNFPFYEDLGIAVIGISCDSSESHKEFKEKNGLPFTLLADEDGKVSEQYGSGVGDTPKRISYLIAPDGTVAKTYPVVIPAHHAEEVLKDLKSIREK
jgi:thioredoxin-dependent peroxiredoxin